MGGSGGKTAPRHSRGGDTDGAEKRHDGSGTMVTPDAQIQAVVPAAALIDMPDDELSVCS